MVEEEEPKSYLEAFNKPNGHLQNQVMDKELERLDRAGTWKVVDKVIGGKKVSCK
jgi:hypothetical protein